MKEIGFLWNRYKAMNRKFGEIEIFYVVKITGNHPFKQLTSHMVRPFVSVKFSCLVPAHNFNG